MSNIIFFADMQHWSWLCVKNRTQKGVGISQWILLRQNTSFWIPTLRWKSPRPKRGVGILLLVYTLDITFSMHIRPHPYWVRPNVHGFSHGLKTCHRHVFLTAFRIPTSIKAKIHPQGVDFCFGGELGIRTLGSFRNHQFSRLAP